MNMIATTQYLKRGFILIVFAFSCHSAYSQNEKIVLPPISKDSTITLEELRNHITSIKEQPFIYNSEKPPYFIGGDSAMISFFQKNIKYPKEVKKGEVEGIVVIRFAVFKDGTISHIELRRSLSKLCDKEALRLVSNMPVWHPFITGGFKVAGYQHLGIYFGNKKLDIVKRLTYKDENISLEEWAEYKPEPIEER